MFCPYLKLSNLNISYPISSLYSCTVLPTPIYTHPIWCQFCPLTTSPLEKRVRRHGFYAKLPSNTKLVARSGKKSKYGNPFTVDEFGLDLSLSKFETWLIEQISTDSDFLKPLENNDLACYCNLKERCHADILILYLHRRRFSLHFMPSYFTSPSLLPAK